MTTSHRKRRSRVDIEASIIDYVLFENASVNKITFHANLNRKAAKIYLSRMVSQGLVKKMVNGSKGWVMYSATEKGILWLKRYRSLGDEGESNRACNSRMKSNFHQTR